MAIQISNIASDLHDANVVTEQIDLYFKSRTPAQEAADDESGATKIIASSKQMIQRLHDIIGRLEV